MTDGDPESNTQVERNVRGILPRSASIIGAFRSSTDQDISRSFVLIIACTLAGIHQQQWNAEEISRTPAASSEDVAISKRRIDALNAHRVSEVEKIDSWYAAKIRGRAEASLHTETLGLVIDRLAIAWVRANNLREAGNRDRARLALRQLTELADAYDDLVRDIGTGQRRLPVWRALKAYGGEAS